MERANRSLGFEKSRALKGAAFVFCALVIVALFPVDPGVWPIGGLEAFGRSDDVFFILPTSTKALFFGVFPLLSIAVFLGHVSPQKISIVYYVVSMVSVCGIAIIFPLEVVMSSMFVDAYFRFNLVSFAMQLMAFFVFSDIILFFSGMKAAFGTLHRLLFGGATVGLLAYATWSLASGIHASVQARMLADGAPYCIVKSTVGSWSYGPIRSFLDLRGVGLFNLKQGYLSDSHGYYHAILKIDRSPEPPEFYNWSIRNFGFERVTSKAATMPVLGKNCAVINWRDSEAWQTIGTSSQRRRRGAEG